MRVGMLAVLFAVLVSGVDMVRHVWHYGDGVMSI